MARGVKVEHLQQGQVILMHQHWVTIAKTPTMGRQFVILTTVYGETGFRFGTLLQVGTPRSCGHPGLVEEGRCERGHGRG